MKASLAILLPVVALFLSFTVAAQAAPQNPQSDEEMTVRDSPSEAPDAGMSVIPDSAAQPSPVISDGDINYHVQPGDSLGSVAATFHVSLADLIKRNRLDAEAMLQVGQLLHIPNPYTAQVRELSSQVTHLSGQVAQLQGKLDAEHRANAEAAEQLDSLRKSNKELTYDTRMMPWWRHFAVSALAAAILMFGVTALTVINWLLLRNRFRTLASLNESLRRLDSKYRAALSRAELRYQQIYNTRRRLGVDRQPVGKLPEETEIDRLNRELKDLLQLHLERLGATRASGARRSRLRDLLPNSSSPVAARTSRR